MGLCSTRNPNFYRNNYNIKSDFQEPIYTKSFPKPHMSNGSSKVIDKTWLMTSFYLYKVTRSLLLLETKLPDVPTQSRNSILLQFDTLKNKANSTPIILFLDSKQEFNLSKEYLFSVLALERKYLLNKRLPNYNSLDVVKLCVPSNNLFFRLDFLDYSMLKFTLEDNVKFSKQQR